jgi:hypothetical protein
MNLHHTILGRLRAARFRLNPLGIASALLVWATVLPAAAPLKVFILAGQSNMEGQAVADLAGPDYNEGRGTLAALMNDPAKAPRFAHLRDDQGNWTVRDDVWVWFQREDRPLLAGPLQFGYVYYGGRHHFGPELQFGHVLGDHFENQVLLIKTAWGGKSLNRDFRPPSSGGETGKYYHLMIKNVREALGRLKTDFPNYDGAGYELAGFVWYHGWNDGVDPQNAVPAYETNLVNLIQDVRRDLNAPGLPVVIGELTGPWVEAPPEWEKLRRAQAAAARHPELRDNVAFVETRRFVRPAADSPNPGHGHHEFGNAETYFLVGDALGKSMRDLVKVPVTRFDPVVREIEGWTVHIEPALIEGEHAAEGARALAMLANHLQRIRILVPQPQLSDLQKVEIWIEHRHPRLGAMQYHPSKGWLVANRHDPRLEKKVHITRAAELLSREQLLKHPAVILHELAHGYHDQFLDFDNPEITAVYEAAKAAGIYEKVLLFTGETVKHYGLNNHKEYFAEGTESYFYRNDFYPFVRAELKQHDPALHDLLEKIWGPAR